MFLARLVLFFAVSGTCFIGTTVAADSSVHLYKYKDSQGNVYVSHQIPPEYYQYGYTALGRSGQVLEIVPPALTPEQRQEELLKMALDKARKQQLEKDEQLLKIYGTTEDAVRTRDGKIKKMDVMIDIAASKLIGLRAEYDRDIARAADSERFNGKVDEKILANLKYLEKEIVNLERDISKKTEHKTFIEKEYAPIIARLKKILAPKQPSNVASSEVQ